MKNNNKNGFNLSKENFSSSNLFKEIKSLSETQIEEISRGVEFISSYLPNAVLIGGSAIVSYLNGGRSLTPDIDFLVNDIESAKDILLNDNVGFGKIIGINGSIGITIANYNIDLLDSTKVIEI